MRSSDSHAPEGPADAGCQGPAGTCGGPVPTPQENEEHPPAQCALQHPRALSAPWLLVTDSGHAAVHIVDVARRRHLGYVAKGFEGPRGVAAGPGLVAVSAWPANDCGSHVVCLFQGTGVCWTPWRTIAGGFHGPGPAPGQLDIPFGLRFSEDGDRIIVAEYGSNRLSIFTAADGAFVTHVGGGAGGVGGVGVGAGAGAGAGLSVGDRLQPPQHALDSPVDVEQWGSGWLVAFESAGLGVVSQGGALVDTLPQRFSCLTAMAWVPGVGLAVAVEDHVEVFGTREWLAMARMSPLRLAWMWGVVAAIWRRGA